jgi:hypothetical protein
MGSLLRPLLLSGFGIASVAADTGNPSSEQIAIGAAVIVIGLFMLWGGATKSNFAPYRFLAARPAVCCGKEHAHRAMVAFGSLMVVFGSINASGMIPRTGSGGH